MNEVLGQVAHASRQSFQRIADPQGITWL